MGAGPESQAPETAQSLLHDQAPLAPLQKGHWVQLWEGEGISPSLPRTNASPQAAAPPLPQPQPTTQGANPPQLGGQTPPFGPLPPPVGHGAVAAGAGASPFSSPKRRRTTGPFSPVSPATSPLAINFSPGSIALLKGISSDDEDWGGP